ncbi:MAG: PepSY-associated TM helix domain-containing protein [Deltaproteobacteria bacterium]|nr:PepSY-associated TM helix domain-containing protein [Deltaproteobacteria bacterium]
MRWRRLNNALHRDIGYAVVGLTLVFATSGLLINHRRDWDAERVRVVVERSYAPVAIDDRAAAQRYVMEALSLEKPKSAWWPIPGELELVYTDHTVRAHPVDGLAWEHREERRGLVKFLHDLHLNRLDRAWTILSDLYALSLATLAITGLFVLKGRNGLSGRGKWFVAAGVVIPLAVAFLL